MESSFDVGKEVVIDFVDVNVSGEGFLMMDPAWIPQNSRPDWISSPRKKMLVSYIK
jgi:hypothetical protein